MLSITERLDQARHFVIVAFELHEQTTNVAVVQWRTDHHDHLEVTLAIEDMVLVRVEVEPNGHVQLDTET